MLGSSKRALVLAIGMHLVGACTAFMSSPLSPWPATMTFSRSFSPRSPLRLMCSLRNTRPSFGARGPGRRQLTSRAFQASEAIAKPPEIDLTFRPLAERVIALGDVHGDLYALDSALMLSDLMDDKGRWTGGKAVLVQMGDILDRGPDESDCLQRLLSLQAQARAEGGDVVMLLGNHEIMNADLDFRYVEPLGWVGWEFDESKEAEMLENLERRQRAGMPPVSSYMLPRIQALERGAGPLAEIMAKMPVAVTIGETVFIHGGLVPEVVSYGLRRMNEETAEWLSGRRARKPWVLDNCKARGMPVEKEVSPLWHRAAGREDVDNDALAEVDAAMRLLGARRLVVGHTPQMQGVNCVRTQEGREVWRVDTGMSEGILSGEVETLEIRTGKDGKERVKVLHAEGSAAAHHRVSHTAESPSWKQELDAPAVEAGVKMPVLTMP